MKFIKKLLPIALVLAVLMASLTPATPILASPGLEQVIIGGYGNVNNTQTRYTSVAGGRSWHYETIWAEQIVTTAGALSNLQFELSGAPGVGTSYTFTLLVNGSPTALAVTIADTNTTGSDTDSVNVAIDDIIMFRSTYSGTPTTPRARWSILFDSSSPGESIVPSGGGACNVTIDYSPVSQGFHTDTHQDESKVYQVMPTSGTFKNLYMKMDEDPGDAPDAYRWTMRKNGASTDLTVTITADNTEANNTVDEVDVVAGDRVNFMSEPLNSPAVQTLSHIGLTFVADIEGESLIMGVSSKNPSITQASYTYLETTALGQTWTTTESNHLQGGQPTTLKKLFVEISTAPGAGKSWEFGIRVNGTTKIPVTISDSSTTGSNTVDYWELSDFDDLSFIATPTNSPAQTTVHWGLVSYTAPPLFPVLTTQDATDILTTTATGNGTITNLNEGGNCTIRGFEWDTDTGAPYENSATDSGDFGLGAYTKGLTNLPPATTIYYRAKAYNTLGWGYGNEVTFVTEGGVPPVVVTGSAVSMTQTGATLQGTLTSLGDYTPVYVFFQYGLTVSYGTDTEEQTKTVVEGFNQVIGNLDPGETYHFRAVVRYGASAYVYGSDGEFETTSTGSPTVTTGSAVNVTSSTAVLQGTLDNLGDYSPVYVAFEWGLTSEYGNQTAEETKTITGGFNANISGLESTTTYHFRARVRYDSNYVYGNDNTFIETEPGEPGVDPPDVLRIDDIKVFTNYLNTDDQLYVIAYRIIYTTGTPVLDVTDYFDFQLLDGAILKAQVPVKSWDYKPGSIYLAAMSAPAWGGSYRIKIIGTPDKWETPPECYRDLTPGDWQGEDLTQLDAWVLSLAESLQNYYNTEMITYVTGGQSVLSPQGGVIFNMGIPGLSTVRPNLFSAKSGYADIDLETDRSKAREEALKASSEERLGPYLTGRLQAAADLLPGDFDFRETAGVGLGLLYLVLALTIGAIAGNMLWGLSTAVLVFGPGVYFGVITPTMIGFIAFVSTAIFIYQVWWKHA